jgi:hypothetical protein
MLNPRLVRSVSSLALPVALFTLIPALGQQPATTAQPTTTQPTITTQPASATPAATVPAKPASAQTPVKEEDPTGIREKMRQELREHPRIARAIIELHETRHYLEHAPNDFGGHKADAIKSIDESIMQLKEALKYDEKHEEKPGERARERRAAGESGKK